MQTKVFQERDRAEEMALGAGSKGEVSLLSRANELEIDIFRFRTGI